MATINEVRFLTNGQIQRRITLTVEGREYAVYDQEAIRDLFTSVVTWETKYVITFPNREYAMTAYLGRVARAASNEGGVQNDELELQSMKITSTMSSVMGKHI